MKITDIHKSVAAAFAVTLLAGCGPSVERAFSNCSELAYKQAVAGNKSLMSREAAKMFEKSARALAEKQCSIIRDECRRDPQAEECKMLIQQYGK